MQIAAHGLGCSVLCLNGMGIPTYTLGWQTYNVYEEFEAFKKDLLSRSRGGIVIWVDTSETESSAKIAEHWYGEETTKASSGSRFAKFLKARGEHVEKSDSYKNPQHEGRCTLYHWYFRKRPVKVARKDARPRKAARGKAVVKKAKTSSRRATA